MAVMIRVKWLNQFQVTLFYTNPSLQHNPDPSLLVARSAVTNYSAPPTGAGRAGPGRFVHFTGLVCGTSVCRSSFDFSRTGLKTLLNAPSIFNRIEIHVAQ